MKKKNLPLLHALIASLDGWKRYDKATNQIQPLGIHGEGENQNENDCET